MEDGRYTIPASVGRSNPSNTLQRYAPSEYEGKIEGVYKRFIRHKIGYVA